MRQSRAAKKRQAKNMTIGVGALLIFAAAVAGAIYYLQTRGSGLDRDTMCPTTGPTGHVILLVDKTDPLNFNQKQAFIRIFEELIDRRVEPGHLVSVFVLGEDYRDGAKPLVEMCNPGTGAGKSELTANIQKLNAQFRDRFRQPLLKQADALVATAPAKTSPLLEMLQLVSINGFRKHAVNGPRRLIVVSDLLHNTPQLSLYKAVPEYPSYAASEYGRKMRTELERVDVEVHEILHSPKVQTRRLLDFWEALLQDAGARMALVRPLEG